MNKVLVTGATGHIGSALCRSLVGQGVDVVALVRPGSEPYAPAEVRTVRGDVLDPESLAEAARGTDVVFHNAARFEVDGRNAASVHETAVVGTRNAIAAAARAGARRVVLTGSVAAVGASPSPDQLLDEESWSEGLSVPYYLAKQTSEREARRAAEELGVELVTVLPTLVLGPGDRRITPSSRLLVDLLRGAGVTFDGGANVIDVRDLAPAMVEAARRGRPGARYILGGENLLVRDLGAMVTRITGRPVRHVSLPAWGMSTVAALMELAAAIRGEAPVLTRDLARDVLGKYAWYDVTRARAELGLRTRATLDTIRDAARYLQDAELLPPRTLLPEAA